MALRRTMLAMLFVAAAITTGCSIPAREPPLLPADTTRALPLGMANARFFADAGPQAMLAEVDRALGRE